MAVTKLETVAANEVTAVCLGGFWQAITAGSFEEKTEGYVFKTPASEPGGAHTVFVPSPGLTAVRK
jgi:hypothetical protein